jgi:hypothetical protein
MCSAGVLWVHYTFGAGLLPLLAFVPRLGWRRAAFAALAIALLTVPLALQIADTIGRRQALSWARSPTFVELLVALGIVFLTPLVILRVAASRRVARQTVGTAVLHKDVLLAVVSLATLAPLLLFVLSWTGITQLFVPRYMLSKEVGMALIGAWILRGIPDPPLRMVALVAQVGFFTAAAAFPAGRHGGEGWRESSSWARSQMKARPGTALVLVSGFVESLQPGILDDPARREILFAPQTVYPVPGEPLRLPWRLTTEAKSRIDSQVVPAARASGRVLVITVPMKEEYEPFLTSRLQQAGLALTKVERFEGVHCMIYERVTGLPSPAAAPERLLRRSESRG